MVTRYSLIFVLFLIILPGGLALGLSGNRLSPIIFEPGKVISNHYTVTDTKLPVNITYGGDLMEYISVTPLVNNEFDMIINFPTDNLPEPKTYHFSLQAEEYFPNAQAGGMGSLIAVSKRFSVIVYSIEKYLTASINALNVNVNSPVEFEVVATSKTYQDIDSVKAFITVFDAEENLVGSVETHEAPLKSLTHIKLRAMFDTTGLEAAQYTAVARTTYDGLEDISNTTFRIGNLDLQLVDYTKSLEPGFSKFVVELQNNWGNPVRNVFAKVFIEEEEILHTPTTTMQPWSGATLEGIVKVDRPVGTYPGKVLLFFEGEEKEVPIELEVREKGSVPEILEPTVTDTTKVLLVVSGIVIAILLFVLIVVLFRRRKKDDDEL